VHGGVHLARLDDLARAWWMGAVRVPAVRAAAVVLPWGLTGSVAASPGFVLGTVSPVQVRRRFFPEGVSRRMPAGGRGCAVRQW